MPAREFLSSYISYLLLGLILYASPSFAAQFEVPLQEGDRLVIRGLSAQVQLVSQPGTSLKITGPEEGSQAGRFVVQKRGQLIEIQMNEFSSKKDWKDSLSRAGAYARKIEVAGPSVPVEIHLRDGSVQLLRWTKEARVRMVQGKITSQNGSGGLQAQLQKGEINLVDQSGKISTDTYNANVTVKNLNGDLEAQAFAGVLSLEKTKGFASLNTQQANVKVAQSSGSLQFENGKGPLTIQGYQGRIEGQTGEGAVTLGFLAESEINLKAKSGRITIQSPPNSGASVNLSTTEGDIQVPKELKVNRLGAEKNVRGRLRGETPKGLVLVRSQEGSIILK